MKAIKIAVPFLLLLALAVPATAYAAGAADGRVVIGGSYTLETGQSLSGDLVIIGGSGDLEPGSRVEGDAALIGGLLNADGEVSGDIFALGGVVNLGPLAVVHGDLITMGAVVNRSEGARVEGQVTEGSFGETLDLQLPGVVIPPIVTAFEGPVRVRGWAPFNVFFDIGWSVLKALLMAGVAVLVVMFWPARTARVARSITAQPVIAFLLGLAAVFFGATLIFFLALTICLSPVSLIGALILAAGLILGWVALGLELGWRLAQAFKRDWHPATQAGVGTLILSLVVFAVGSIPCLGPFFGAIVWLIGLGAVLLTRFGGQDSPPMTSLTSV